MRPRAQQWGASLGEHGGSGRALRPHCQGLLPAKAECIQDAGTNRTLSCAQRCSNGLAETSSCTGRPGHGHQPSFPPLQAGAGLC